MKSSTAKKKLMAAQVEKIVQATPIIDVHTHLYDPAFGNLLLWGLDDLLVYHYLVAESFRYFDMPYKDFWGLSKIDQASMIWDALFIKHSPISESCRGILTTLNALDLNVKKRDLRSLRKRFATQKPAKHITHCMKLANVKSIYMTNSPFDDLERPVWEKGFARDERFVAALRIDQLFLSWPEAAMRLASWGYAVTPSLTQKTFSEVRRFLADWSKKLQARYLMISFPNNYLYPANTDFNRLLEEAILPHCRDFNLPFALMPGVRRAVNPQLRLAGDGVGPSNLESLMNLCAKYPDNKFLATVLARENQHELCVLTRKFRNLHIFGCWWFLNNPSLIEEMTRMRFELLGLSMTPQHSDARVLDQIIYKWQHSKKIIGRVLIDKYSDLMDTGWQISRAEIERDVTDLFGGAFEQFCKS
jgi:hypothetical protein